MKRPSQHGFSLLEMMAALAIGMFMLFGLTAILNSSLQDTKGQQTAQYQALFSGAAKRYLDDNYVNLLDSIAAGATLAVTLGVLNGSTPLSGSTPPSVAYLPPSFAATNAYRQTPCMLIYKKSPTELEVLIVTEGGDEIPDADIGYAAAMAGTGGGAIRLVTPNNPTSGLIARGAYGGWLLDNTSSSPNLNTFTYQSCSGNRAEQGHLATALFYGAGQVAADFLYRSNNGNPTYNTMSTPIIMANDAIQTAGDDCGPNLAIAVNALGHLLSCDTSHKWSERAVRSSWREPVPTHFELLMIPDPRVGDVAVNLNLNEPMVFEGPSPLDWEYLTKKGSNQRAITTHSLTAGRITVENNFTSTGNFSVFEGPTNNHRLFGTIDVENDGPLQINGNVVLQDEMQAGRIRPTDTSGNCNSSQTGTIAMKNTSGKLVVCTRSGGISSWQEIAFVP
jgi:type II secretory pathway pseudopilin PulG